MSLALRRCSGESVVLIDERNPGTFVLVTITDIDRGQIKLTVDAPSSVHIVRREILHRYDVHGDVLAGIDRIDASRGHPRSTDPQDPTQR